MSVQRVEEDDLLEGGGGALEVGEREVKGGEGVPARGVSRIVVEIVKEGGDGGRRVLGLGE